jgi:hypothetical protein
LKSGFRTVRGRVSGRFEVGFPDAPGPARVKAKIQTANERVRPADPSIPVPDPAHESPVLQLGERAHRGVASDPDLGGGALDRYHGVPPALVDVPGHVREGVDDRVDYAGRRRHPPEKDGGQADVAPRRGALGRDDAKAGARAGVREQPAPHELANGGLRRVAGAPDESRRLLDGHPHGRGRLAGLRDREVPHGRQNAVDHPRDVPHSSPFALY